MPINTHTDPRLLARLSQAAKRGMTADEVRSQRVSYVYGNMPKNSTLTRAQVGEAIAKLEGSAV